MSGSGTRFEFDFDRSDAFSDRLKGTGNEPGFRNGRAGTLEHDSVSINRIMAR